MFAHYYISKEWMLSARARRVYRVSGFGTLALFVGLLALPPDRHPSSFV